MLTSRFSSLKSFLEGGQNVSPDGIFQRVRDETDEVLQIFDQSVEDEELAGAIENARSGFMQGKEACDDVLVELERAAEWDFLTIAFYGETNAGKSTIIETLRILLGEKTKQEEQRRFFEFRDQCGLDDEGIRKWRDLEVVIEGKQREICELQQRGRELAAEREKEVFKIQGECRVIEEKISSYPFWRRLISFLWKIPEKEQLNAARASLDSVEEEGRRVEQEQKQTEAALVAEVERMRLENQHVSELMEKLAGLEDGGIIGDGRHDFTRGTTRYEFNAGDKRFVILDVPGIEGNESLVNDEIMNAVRKAHIVFYVTGQAKPPEKGDEKRGRGTIEKIKEHLRAQTEVYAIYNKRINNPAQLDGDLVGGKDERAALDAMEKVLKEQLGEHYKGLHVLSAGPAFLMSTECFAPDGINFRKRTKFVSNVPVQEVFKKTAFSLFADRVRGEMLRDAEKRIKQSNFNKAYDAVANFAQVVDAQVEEVFLPLQKKLEGRKDAAMKQVRIAEDAFGKGIKSDISDLIESEKRRVRNDVYSLIEDGLDNDSFKLELEIEIQSALEKVEAKVPRLVEKAGGEFEERVDDISRQYMDNISDVVQSAELKSVGKFRLNIDIDNGISYVGIAGAVLSVGIFLASGGSSIAVAAVLAVVSLVKAVWAYFDDDYKKSQQKKAADESIAKAFRQLEESCSNALKELEEKIGELVERIDDGYELPVRQSEKMTSLLRESSKQLEIISNEIKLNGGLR